MIKKLIPSAAVIGFLSLARSAFAQDDEVIDTIQLQGAQGDFGINAGTGLNTIISNAITIIFVIAAILVLVMLIWGGIEWVLSGGDKEKVANARKRIINALVGMAIIALAFFIVRVVGGILGFNILTDLQIPTLERPIDSGN